jgi:hypothetical protein
LKQKTNCPCVDAPRDATDVNEPEVHKYLEMGGSRRSHGGLSVYSFVMEF